MSLNRSIGSDEYMKRRIPKNAKYEHVKARLDTGCSSLKYLEKLEELRKNYKYRKDEVFKRLKVTTFAQLILQVALLSDDSQSDDEAHVPRDCVSVVSDADQACPPEYTNGSLSLPVSLSHCQDAGDSKDICHSSRSTLLSVISGVGELNLDEVSEQMELVCSPAPLDTPYPDCPYLLLDVRDQDQYDHCHIISARSFPVARLSRTMNPYTKEVLEYKNSPGKIIVVYDEDELVSSQAATSMCQRGFENLFMLSGGLKVIAQKFPSGMVTGSFPTSCLSSPASKSRRRSASQQPAQTAERRWRFTCDELTKIQEQLEEMLLPTNSNSRTSSCSTTSRVPSAASGRLSSSSSSASKTSSRIQSSRAWK